MSETTTTRQREFAAARRASAVAKLKRAASLPRMQDGRRPAMPREAVSDPERPPSGDSPDASTEGHLEPPSGPPTPEEVGGVGAEDNHLEELTIRPGVWKSARAILAGSNESFPDEQEKEGSSSVSQTPVTPTTPLVAPTPTKAKRRSRSRSRSRGSKDLRKRMQSPALSSGPDYSGGPDDSSADEQPTWLSPLTMPQMYSSPFASPVPSRMATPALAQFAAISASPGPNPISRAMSPLGFSPTGAFPFYNAFAAQGAPPSAMPSLEAIQGLYRHKSTSERKAAYSKLTGETSEDGMFSDEVSPLKASLKLSSSLRVGGANTTVGLDSNLGLQRAATVSGGDRINARRNLLATLKRKNTGDIYPGDITSGGEETPTASPPATVRSRRSRRRSKRQSGGATGTGMESIVDDREPLSPTTEAAGLLSATDEQLRPFSPPYSLNNPLYEAIKRGLGEAGQLSPHRTLSSEMMFTPRSNEATVSSSGITVPISTSPLQPRSLSRSPAPPAPRSPAPHWPTPPPVSPSPRPSLTPQPYRGVVVEEEDDLTDLLTHLSSAGPQGNVNGRGLPQPPPISKPMVQRIPHSSDAPSVASGHTIPVYLSESASNFPPRYGRVEDAFPSSPFHSPLKESTSTSSVKRDTEDEEEEHEEEQSNASNYQDPPSQSRGRSPYLPEFEQERQVSWVEQPQIPVHDEDEDEDEVDDEAWENEEREEEVEAVEELGDEALTGAEPSASSSSPRRSYDSKEAAADLETSPDIGPIYGPPSPSSAVALYTAPSNTSRSESVGTPDERVAINTSSREPLSLEPLNRSRSNLGSDFEYNRSATSPELYPSSYKRGQEASGGPSTWEKVKSTFRSGSSSGRRSRTNSVSKGNVNDSSRESAGSEGLPVWSQSQSPGGLYSPSASTTYLSSTPQLMARGAPSPLPFAGPSQANAAKYNDAKLFPLPGLFQPDEMRRIEEQRKRGPLPAASLSTSDIPLSPSTSGDTMSSGTPTIGRYHDDSFREQHIARQPSNPSFANGGGYFNLRGAPPRSPSPPPKDRFPLPTTRKAAVEWMRHKRPSSSKSSPSSPVPQSPGPTSPLMTKKPSLSDLLKGKKEEIIEWEESDIERGQTPKATPMQKTMSVEQQSVSSTPVSHSPSPLPPTPPQMPDAKSPSPIKDLSFEAPTSGFATGPSASPMTPSDSVEPLSSAEANIPSRSTSQSSLMQASPFGRTRSGILLKLDETLRPGNGNATFNLAVDDPPRKLLLSSQVLQVCNANTVKDRFLFLFSDLLVIAKPIFNSDESLMNLGRPSPQDRKFIIKSVAELSKVLLKDEPSLRPKSDTRHPIMRSFVSQFTKDADQAISNLLDKTRVTPDPLALGELLFNTVDIDRAQLGAYMCQKSSKLVLKAYLDSFHFQGMRIDKALRAFLCSLHAPANVLFEGGPLEYLVDAFSSRWHQANPTVYDKYLAMRLARALVHLNEHLHRGVIQEPGVTGYTRNHISLRDFVQGFRQKDQKRGVSDQQLTEFYTSITNERLSQAANPNTTKIELISIKRTFPVRLTHRRQSEPIIVRIPQADPLLTVHLHGQDLIFDPPVLSFAKSAEAAFRVTGSALGRKSMIMYRAGLNAPRYTGLPLGKTLVIEREFMRHTFELVFPNHLGVKRRYMFSVDDPLIKDGFIQTIRRQMEMLTMPSTAFEQAAQALAYKTLAEHLIDTAHKHLGPSPQPSWSTNTSGVSFDQRFKLPNKETIKEKRLRHMRSSSRSDVYYKAGPGQYESEADQDGPEFLNGLSSVPESPSWEGRLWDGAEVELICRQSSAIPVVLNHLRWATAEERGSGVQSPSYFSNRI